MLRRRDRRGRFAPERRKDDPVGAAARLAARSAAEQAARAVPDKLSELGDLAALEAAANRETMARRRAADRETAAAAVHSPLAVDSSDAVPSDARPDRPPIYHREPDLNGLRGWLGSDAF